MKFHITMFDKDGKVDCPTMDLLYRYLEKTSLEECDVILLTITYMNDYVIDEAALLKAKALEKKIVIVDLTEYGWDKMRPDHVYGINTESWAHKFENKDYFKLSDFIKASTERIVLYFHRELPKGSIIETVYKRLPIEFPGFHEVNNYNENPVSFEEYDKRPIDIIMIYGLSNPSRPILYGELAKRTALNGQELVTNLHHIRDDKTRQVVLLFTPDFARVDIKILLELQQHSKISISMNGAGVKCFRSCEASYNTVMAFQENNMEWSYPWDDGINSIELPNRSGSPLIDEYASYDKLMKHLNEPDDLYKIYLRGLENWRNYRSSTYSSNYFVKQIKEAL